MKTKMRPLGVSLEIQHEGKTYFGHLYNDWDRFKTYENHEIDLEDGLILFDDSFNRIPYESELYDVLTPLVEEHLLKYEHSFEDWEDDDE